MRDQHAGRTGRPGIKSTAPRGRRWTLGVAAVAACLAGYAGLVVAAPNAAAAIVGLETVSGNTVSDSSFRKRLQVKCPDGLRALGGDISISGSNQVRIAEIYPLIDAVRFAAVEPVEGVSANWSFTARAVCAPLSSLPGYRRVTVNDEALVLEGGATIRVSTRDKAFDVFCPAGTSLVGFGGGVHAGAFLLDDLNLPRTRLTRIQPILGLRPPGHDADNGEGVPKGFRVDGNAGGYDGIVRAFGAGICANTDQITMNESLQLTGLDSVNAKSATRRCESASPTLITSGFSVESDTDADLEVGITALNADRLFNRATSIGRESATGTSENWLLGVYVVCTP